MTPFQNILVANRGEIAVRIIRTARSLGYRTIAVHSEADADAPHTRLADEALCIGPAPVRESYLNIERILEAARQAGADAIHPGYGFLSESAEFAQACADAGIAFIGPTPEAIGLMGDKAAAKRRMIEAGVPCVPGYEDEDQTDARLTAAAGDIGYPIMVKASAGGGGRGMRLVASATDLPLALQSARSEAMNAFGSDVLLLEKAIAEPRHVEIQVFADNHGNVIHLGERDCSVQRRHQKVVEEAPCPVLTDDLRRKMGAAAVEAARSIGYRGAGTVEFLLAAVGGFYFLEMNTRLQVEHPVTEMITGLDLVAMQIAVASGQPLPLAQDDVRLNGHAIEVRLYAEDPANEFMPATGAVKEWRPAEGDGIRVDSGIRTGGTVSPFYDPMLAKLIAWGPDRDTARRRLIDALSRTALFGVTSNKGFLIDVLKRERFAAGEATTAFIEQEFAREDLVEAMPSVTVAAMAAVLQYRHERDTAMAVANAVTPALLDWGSGGPLATRYVYDFGEESIDLLVRTRRDRGFDVFHGGETLTVELLEHGDGKARLNVNGRRHEVLFSVPGRGLIDLDSDGRQYRCRNRIAFPTAVAQATGEGHVVAPMHGALLEILVAPGDAVEIGTRLAVLEAMKMQHDIVADVKGTVSEVLAAAGSQVAADQLLIEIDAG